MGTQDQDFWQQERINDRADELEMIRAIRVSEMMAELLADGETDGVSFCDVVEALDCDIDTPLHLFWSRPFDKGTTLRDLITAKAEQLCWMAARNAITHNSLERAA